MLAGEMVHKSECNVGVIGLGSRVSRRNTLSVGEVVGNFLC